MRTLLIYGSILGVFYSLITLFAQYGNIDTPIMRTLACAITILFGINHYLKYGANKAAYNYFFGILIGAAISVFGALLYGLVLYLYPKWSFSVYMIQRMLVASALISIFIPSFYLRNSLKGRKEEEDDVLDSEMRQKLK